MLKVGPRAGLAVPRPPLDPVVPALRHLDLAARADRRAATSIGPIRRSSSASRCSSRPGEYARGLDDDAVDAARERRRRGQSGRRVRPPNDVGEWVAAARYPEEQLRGTRRGRGPRRAGVPRRRSTISCTEGVVHRVIPWDDVSLDEGTGIVHIAPGCGTEDFELAQVHELGARSRSTSRAASTTASAGCTGSRRPRRRSRSSATSRRGASSSRPVCTSTAIPSAGAATRRSIFRIADDWFISVRESAAADARRERDRRVDAGVHGQADGRLAPQHGRLEHLPPPLLRPAAARSIPARAGTST